MGLLRYMAAARAALGEVMARPAKIVSLAAVVALAGCAPMFGDTAPDAPEVAEIPADQRPYYLIGPLDGLQIYVWRSPELTTSVSVRPDGRISVPLIDDLIAAGKTPRDLADDIEESLSEFVQNPLVTVVVNSFNGPYDQQVRVMGEAAEPRAMPYVDNMTVLDALIAVGGLTVYADGNAAVLSRRADEAEGRNSYRVRLEDLLEDGDMTANARLLPGDVIIIPEAWF